MDYESFTADLACGAKEIGAAHAASVISAAFPGSLGSRLGVPGLQQSQELPLEMKCRAVVVQCKQRAELEAPQIMHWAAG